jgi:hypothetical protein
MDIALHKHSAHMNILPNRDEDLRKKNLPSAARGTVAQSIPVAQEVAKSGAPYLQIRMDLVNKYLRPFVIEHLDS